MIGPCKGGQIGQTPLCIRVIRSTPDVIYATVEYIMVVCIVMSDIIGSQAVYIYVGWWLHSKSHYVYFGME